MRTPKRLISKNLLLRISFSFWSVAPLIAETAIPDKSEQPIEWEQKRFSPGAGKYQNTQLAADDEIRRVTLMIDVEEAHIHPRWNSMVDIALTDMDGSMRVRFWVSHSVKKVGKSAVRIYRDDESEKPHYLDSQGLKDYVGEHELTIEIDDEGNMSFLVNGEILETHQKNFRIEGVEITVVGTTADVAWAIE
ncbi:hypothetical protein [Puniceicoccus vermicola]|nr:hypothetical protein [Puniceicoccus vermicola]